MSTTLRAGQSVVETLAAGDFIAASGFGEVDISLSGQVRTQNISAAQTVGPYLQDALATIRATSGDLTYEITKRTDAADQIPVYATPSGQLTVGGRTIDLTAIVIASLAPQLQTLTQLQAKVSALSYSDISGFGSAGAIKLASGQTLESVVQELRDAIPTSSPSAPSITTAPAVDDTTPTVNQVINITAGSVTDGSGRSHVNTYKVTFLGLIGFQPTYQTATTYQVPANALNYPMLVTQRSTDSVVSSLYTERDSVLTSAVGGVVPTVDVAPTMSPSGAQGSGVAVTLGNGTITAHTGSSIAYRLWNVFVAGVKVATVDSRVTNVYQSDLSAVGKTITATVIGVDDLGLQSIETAFSNSVTINGTPYQASSAVALPATVTEGSAATITPAVWPTTYNSAPFSVTVQRREIFFDGDTIIGATLPAASLTYTPELPADLPSALITAGYTKTAGAVIKVKETVLGSDGQTYTSVSATKTIQAASATLALTLTAAGTAGVQWTVGQQISPATFAQASGGNSVYTYSMSGLPAGVALSSGGTQWPATGTPSAPFSQANVAITVNDSAGHSAGPVYVPVQVSAANVTPLSIAFKAPSTSGQNGIYELEAPNDADTTSYASHGFSNGLSIPPLSAMNSISRGGVIRLGPTTVDGVPCVRHEIRQSDPLRNSGSRSELTFDNLEMVNDTDYWFAHAFKPDANMILANFGGSGDRFSIWQIHQDSSISPGQNPFGCYMFGDSSAGLELNWFTALNSTQATRTVYRSSLNAGHWWRCITHVRMSQTNAIFEVWVAYGSGAYTKLTEISAGASTAAWGESAASASKPYYTKSGFYKWTTGVWGSATTRGMYCSAPYWGKGVNLYNEAAAAVAQYAIP